VGIYKVVRGLLIEMLVGKKKEKDRKNLGCGGNTFYITRKFRLITPNFKVIF